MLKGFWVRNFKTLRQVGIGSCFRKFAFINNEKSILPHDLGPVTLFIGASGTGKSSAIDVFEFISDTFRYGVEIACLKRGGFDSVYSQGGKGSLSFGFQYQERGEADIATYAVSIYRTKQKIPYIESEILTYQQGDKTFPIMFLQNGAEKTIRYLAPDERLGNADMTKIEFTDHNRLGLAALESHPQFPVLASFRSLFENWTICHFTPDPARGLDHSLHRRHESPHGVSLSGLIRYVARRYGNHLQPLLLRVASAIPNVEKIILDETNPEKPLLSFQLGDREVPVPITHLSSSTIRLFTYTLLLEEEEPELLTIIEEPENGLDREHRHTLTQTLHRFAETSRPHRPQVFFSSHHSALANDLHPSQVWVFEKDRSGFTAVERASDSILFESEADLENPQWFRIFFDEKR